MSNPIEWQPIETAPKDGTRILGFNENLEVYIPNIYFWDDKWITYFFDEYSTELTHWMPLPKPPKK